MILPEKMKILLLKDDDSCQNESVVTAAAYRGMLQRMRQGDFDPVLPPRSPVR